MTENGQDSLYNRAILHLAATIPHLGHLEKPQGSATTTSPICGSRVCVDVILDNGHILDFAQTVRACALGQASASILGRHVLKCDCSTIRSVRDALKYCLSGNGDFTKLDWPELALFAPAQTYKARHPSIMLALDSCCSAIENAQKEKKQIRT